MMRRMIVLLVLLLALPCAGGLAETSPTTGLTGEGAFRPVLVEISNSPEARPQIGLCDADIVYEYILWGPGHTRYLALYNDMHPEQVVSVRSTRISSVDLAAPWGCPMVFFGGQQESGTDAYERMDAAGIPEALRVDGTRPSDYADLFSRLEGREPPHNAAVDVGALARVFWPADAAAGEPLVAAVPDALLFLEKAPEGGDAAAEIRIAYDARDYFPSYVYDEAGQVYKRFYNGMPQKDGADGTEIVASNVIVQYCDTEFYEQKASQPVIATVGSGRAELYVGGQRFEGMWSRKTVQDHIAYTGLDGTPLTLLPGKTFVQIVPSSQRMVEDGDGVWTLQ